MAMYRMSNSVQQYEWGSTNAIPELLGLETNSTDPVPMAELWMGAHPKAPSRIIMDGRERSLFDVIREDPGAMLGDVVAEEYGATLPYLFKVLAARKVLSIQSHPNKEQAKEGWDRENEKGIALDAPERNYRDANHKPELICALTPFWALRGFRTISEIRRDFDAIGSPAARSLADMVAKGDSSSLKSFFARIMQSDVEERRELVQSVVTHAENRWSELRAAGVPEPRELAFDRRTRGPGAEDESLPERFFWTTEIARQFPGDIGSLGPLYLNTVYLRPGEAMFLSAGVLHAYLRGTGVELMANSDNVLRGGCTPKHIDVPELLKTVTFVPDLPRILLPEGDRIRSYRSRAREFRLSVVDIQDGESPVHIDGGTPTIVFCVEGTCELKEEATLPGQQSVPRFAVRRGQSVFLTGSSAGAAIQGNGRFFIAGVGSETGLM